MRQIIESGWIFKDFTSPHEYTVIRFFSKQMSMSEFAEHENNHTTCLLPRNREAIKAFLIMFAGSSRQRGHECVPEDGKNPVTDAKTQTNMSLLLYSAFSK